MAHNSANTKARQQTIGPTFLANFFSLGFRPTHMLHSLLFLPLFSTFLTCTFKIHWLRRNMLMVTSLPVPFHGKTQKCVLQLSLADVLCKDYSRSSIIHDCVCATLICRYLRGTVLHLATEYEDILPQSEQPSNTLQALKLFDGWLNHGAS